jgi:hypothetical protein
MEWLENAMLGRRWSVFFRSCPENERQSKLKVPYGAKGPAIDCLWREANLDKYAGLLSMELKQQVAV